MPSYSDVLKAVRALTPEDRMRLLEALWDDMLPADWPLPDQAWLLEAQRRSDAFDQGRMPAAPWSEVRERARKQAGIDG
jgi:putative addiction module component (TIGR02574 family)